MNIIPNFSFETNVSLEGYTSKKEASLCLSKKGAAIIGRNRNVLKMTVVNPKGCRMEAVYFGDIPAFQAFVEKEYGRMEVENMFRGRENSVDLAFTYYPEINEYNGRRSLQIIISHYCRIKNT